MHNCVRTTLRVGLPIWMFGCTGKGVEPNPAARYNAAGGLDIQGEVLHLVGGADGSGALHDAWALDIPHRQWVRVDGPADPLLSAAAARVDAELWVSSGSLADGSETDQLAAWETRGGAWLDQDPGTVRPSARREATLTRVAEAQAVLIGGNTDDAGDPGSTLADVWGLDTSGPTWTEVTTTGGPSGLQRHATTFDGSQLWVHGGVDPDGTLSGALWSLDISTWSWTEHVAADLAPSARADHLLAAWDDRLVLWGGDLDDPDVWVYAPATSEWTAHTGSSPAPRDAFVWDVVEDQPWAVMVGGDTGGTYESDVWVLRLDSLEWTELLQLDNSSF